MFFIAKKPQNKGFFRYKKSFLWKKHVDKCKILCLGDADAVGSVFDEVALEIDGATE